MVADPLSGSQTPAEAQYGTDSTGELKMTPEQMHKVVYETEGIVVTVDGVRLSGTRDQTAIFFLWCELNGHTITEQNKWGLLKLFRLDRPSPPEGAYSHGTQSAAPIRLNLGKTDLEE